MSYHKSHFWTTKSQRNGILFLAITIIGIQASIYWIDLKSPSQGAENKFVNIAVQNEIDSLKLVQAEINTLQLKPFNPSFLSDYKGYILGMTTPEIDRILSHRKSGKYITSASEFQLISQISDSLLGQITPFFKFPTWTKKNNSIQLKSNDIAQDSTKALIKVPILDINTASQSDLKRIYGIGDKLALRILKYREKLGGFTLNEQLFEVYYLDSLVVQRILDKYQVLTKPNIQKIDVNNASFREVLSIAYLDYELTKKIFAYKDEFAEIQSLEELKNIEGFPIEKFDRIALYLSVK